MRSRIIERVIHSPAGVSSLGSSKSPSSPQHPTRAFTQRPSIVGWGHNDLVYDTSEFFKERPIDVESLFDSVIELGRGRIAL